MSAADSPMVPRGALVLAGALVAFALGATSLARISGMPPMASPERLRAEERVEPLTSRQLKFLDRADGGVTISDARTGALVRAIAPGPGSGFIRGVMRGLARERMMHGAGDAQPFALTAWKDGELSLTDTATGRSIELSAFGPTNRQSFATLLEDRR